MTISSVAVIGAGVMGANIAAHMANAGASVLLLDIVPEGADNRNVLAEGAVAAALKADPAPFMHTRNARKIRCGNIEDDLAEAGQCDWVVEAIVERLDIKQDFYKRLAKVRAPDTIVSSNTSTIPLAKLVEGAPADFSAHFLISHFFNPPRYLRLLELVAGPDTLPYVMQRVREFGDVRLGKHVIECHDTPGFIANRVGSYWVQVAIDEAIGRGLKIEEVDAILGAPMGVPKTGIFALMDFVGLDLMPHVRASMSAHLPPSDRMLQGGKMPAVIEKMISDGRLGRKSGGGFYSTRREGGRRQKLAIDLASGEYRDAEKVRPKEVRMARKSLQALFAHDSPLAQLAWRVMSETLVYAAELLPEIAERPSDIDAAMRTGYGWKYGPFELLDRIGVAWFNERLVAEGRALPAYLQASNEDVYALSESALTERTKGGRTAVPRAAGVHLLSDIKRVGKPITRNGSASLWDVGDGVLCLEFHSKMNAVDPGILTMMHKALAIVPRGHQALVIHNEAENFSVGANIGLLLFAANLAAWDQIRTAVVQGQQTLKALRDAPFPVVGAPSGMALGGGCEVLLHCDAVQAHAETYMGLVEVGVGLVPGWGGCKELLTRWYHNPRRPGGPMPAISKVFECVSTATVAKSADEARELLFLRAEDRITMNRDRLLADAKLLALELVDGYQPPAPAEPLFLPGDSAQTAMAMAVDGFHKVGKATAHDTVVARALAGVLSGGDTDLTDPVDEDALYALECDAFVTLAQHPHTLARVEHMLDTGRPLRN